MTTLATNTPAAAPSFLSRMTAAFKTRRQKAMTRRELSALSDRDLDDIGITRGDIDAIVRGTF